MHKNKKIHTSIRLLHHDAYDVEAFGYLLKPVDDRKLKNVLKKAVLKTERRSQEFIIVSRERQKKKLFLDDIYYFEMEGRRIDIHGAEGQNGIFVVSILIPLNAAVHDIKQVV